MIGLIATFCFAIGLGVGAVLFRQFQSDTIKVVKLEKKLLALQLENDSYRENVHSHFNTTAQLMNKLTDNYRDVYRQLATSAQALCPESISSQLSLSPQADDVLSENIPNKDNDKPNDDDVSPSDNTQNEPTNTEASTSDDPLFPPRDYSPKSDPNQKGNLAEDYGLDKTPPTEPKQ